MKSLFADEAALLQADQTTDASDVGSACTRLDEDTTGLSAIVLTVDIGETLDADIVLKNRVNNLTSNGNGTVSAVIGGISQLQQGGQQQQPTAAAANRLNKTLLFLIAIDTKGSRLILNAFHL
jgi:hypothetical protein